MSTEIYGRARSGSIDIPIERLRDGSLTPSEKLLLGLVEYVDLMEDGCRWTSAEIAEHIGTTPCHANRMVRSLYRQGYLTIRKWLDRKTVGGIVRELRIVRQRAEGTPR